MTVETIDENGVRHNIQDAQNESWSTHYGSEGGGYGYYKFTLPRKIGMNYPDIGFGYEITRRKRLGMVQFHGQIRQIDEDSSDDMNISITALGWSVVSGDDELLRAFCDKRLSLWKTSDEVPKGLFRPDQFGTGSNALGLYLHASPQEINVDAYTELGYEFYEGEVAKRLRCDLSANLGSGILFEAEVSAIDIGSGFVDYTNDVGEGSLDVGMTLFNDDQNQFVTIDAINTTSNRLTVTGSLASWVAGDDITVYGPFFQAQIATIVDDTITYTNQFGEANIATGQTLVNITQKAVATVSSNSTGADTITVSDEDHITGWRVNDVILISASLFQATISSIVTDTITYSSPIGERLVSTTIGWYLHNVTQDDLATVSAWAPGSNQVVVDTAGDISGWVGTDVIRIYSPYRVEILDSDNNVLWPTTDAREGAIPRNRTDLDLLTTGSPTGFKVRLIGYLAGSGNDQNFAQLSDLRVYSTESEATITTLAQYAASILSAAGHDLNSSTLEIETINRSVEPMVFEFNTFKEALSEIASFGDENYNELAWGIRLDERKILYVEVQPPSTNIAYKIRRIPGKANISASGDISESFQRVRGAYTDKLGVRQTTYWISDTTAYFANRYRATTIDLQNVDTEAEAVGLATKFLEENKIAKVSAQYSAQDGAVFLPGGVPLPFDEVQATGEYVEIEEWRSVETGTPGTSLLHKWSIERIVAVEVDYEARTVNLIPSEAKKTFEKYMAALAKAVQT